MKIFVVDDDPDSQEIIKKALCGYDAEIEFANDAAFAVKRLGEEGADFDKIICDGLFGEWEKVYKVAQESGLSMLLYTGRYDFLDAATEKGIPNLDKASSIREFQNKIFPQSGSVEAK